MSLKKKLPPIAVTGLPVKVNTTGSAAAQLPTVALSANKPLASAVTVYEKPEPEKSKLGMAAAPPLPPDEKGLRNAPGSTFGRKVAELVKIIAAETGALNRVAKTVASDTANLDIVELSSIGVIEIRRIVSAEKQRGAKWREAFCIVFAFSGGDLRKGKNVPISNQMFAGIGFSRRSTSPCVLAN